MVRKVTRSGYDYEFHAGLPADCPNQAAVPVSGTIFRGIKKMPLSEMTFHSHRECDLTCDEAECECWGLSVWNSLAAVEHALRTFRHMKKWHVASGTLNPDDGLILHTPNKTQPQHHTFWRDLRSDFEKLFEITISPPHNYR